MLKAQLSLNKILLITDLYPIDDSDNTIPLAIENFALALNELGYEIDVIRPNFLLNTILRKHKIYKQKIYQRNNIQIYNKNFILPFIFDDFKPSKKYDLIISHMPCGNIYADLINKKLKIPRISILHNSDYKVLSDIKYSFYFKNRLKIALKNSDVTGARNCILKEKLKADFILPSFIDKNHISEHKKAQSDLKIITISRLIKRKNIDMVLDALKDLNCSFKYDIYGDGKDRNRLEKMVKTYNLESKVVFHGAIEHDLIWKKLNDADIFILPSEDETFGLCYLEAMAKGLIVIAKNNESMNNIIENSKNGFLVNNSNDIKNILKNLTLDKKQEIINNTLENIKNFEKERVIKDYLEVIKKCK